MNYLGYYITLNNLSEFPDLTDLSCFDSHVGCDGENKFIANNPRFQMTRYYFLMQAKFSEEPPIPQYYPEYHPERKNKCNNANKYNKRVTRPRSRTRAHRTSVRSGVRSHTATSSPGYNSCDSGDPDSGDPPGPSHLLNIPFCTAQLNNTPSSWLTSTVGAWEGGRRRDYC